MATGVLLLLGLVQPAHADPYGIGSPGNVLPDDRLEDYCLSGSNWHANPLYMEVVSYAMLNLDYQTNMRVQSTACAGDTDIHFVLDPGLPVAGDMYCDEYDGPFQCNRTVARINPDVVWDELPDGAEGQWFYMNLVKTACHVVGRAVGLVPADGNNDCMEEGDVSGWDWWDATGYHDHHVRHINSGLPATF